MPQIRGAFYPPQGRLTLFATRQHSLESRKKITAMGWLLTEEPFRNARLCYSLPIFQDGPNAPANCDLSSSEKRCHVTPTGCANNQPFRISLPSSGPHWAFSKYNQRAGRDSLREVSMLDAMGLANTKVQEAGTYAVATGRTFVPVSTQVWRAISA